MDEKLKGFFDTATQKVQADTTARTVAQQKEDARKKAQAANGVQLDAQIKDELSDILDVLRNLPEKDGKRFNVETRNSDFGGGSDAERRITIAYVAPHRYDDYKESSGYDSPKPEIGLTVRRADDGTVRLDVTQYSMMEYESGMSRRRYRHVSCPDYEALRQQLGLGVANIAANRMEEIGLALGVPKPAAPDPEQFAGLVEPIDVFAKPLKLKGVSAPPPVVKDKGAAPLSMPETAAATLIARAPLWKRVLGMG